MRIAWIGSNSWQQLKSRETQSEGMKLDSISAISEVAKFYGTLDQVFRLLNRLNSTTRKIWNSVWAKLAEDIKRKRIKIDWENREMFVEVPIENKFVLSLFQPVDFDVETKASLKMLLELFENVENPQMLKMNVSINLTNRRDTFLNLWNSVNYIEYNKLYDLELYNKIIETAIRRQIHLQMMICFAFIHEIPSLKNIKFIRSIVFLWNKSSNSTLMISIWIEFWTNNKLRFENVFLIWDDMEIDKFMNIFLAVSDTKCKLIIHVNKENNDFYKLFDRITLNQLSLISIKLWDKQQFILWESNNLNEIHLKKWYYQSPLHPKKYLNFQIDTYNFKISNTKVEQQWWILAQKKLN